MNENKTYPIERVLNDADHLANSAEQLLLALNKLYGAEAKAEAEETATNVAAVDECQSEVADFFAGVRLATHNYRKRARRYRESVAAIAAAEPAPRWPQVDMGFGKFAVGSSTCAVTGAPGLIYLHLPEPREFNADCADLFPTGAAAPERSIASVIHFHSAKALQQTLDELLAIQREHYPVAEQAQQAEPVAWGCFHFGGKRDGKLYSFSDTKEQADAYIANIHQSRDDITLRSGPIYAKPPAVAVPEWGGPKAYHEGRALYEEEIGANGRNSGWRKFGDIDRYDQAHWIAKAAMLAAAPQAAGGLPDGYALAPVDFIQGFHALAHNYSLQAQAPDYYAGRERDAFSAAYARCGSDLAKLRAMLAAAPQAAVSTGWIDPNDKTQKQFLPHIGEPVLFCHGGVTYYGVHTGGSFKTGHGVTARTFGTWDCLWMYPPAAGKKGGA